MSRLQLLGVFLLSFLALRTACHPRPTASSRAITVDIAQDGHVGVTPVSGLASVDRTSNISLGRRNLGFQEFLPIGNGWNMYYSSWPLMALPIREYHFEYRTPADLVATPRVRNDVGGPGLHVRRPDRLVVDLTVRVLKRLADVSFRPEPAAFALTNLYASMVLQVRSKWANLPPQHSLSLMYGGVHILMHCQEQPIPWLFVEKFANTLLQMTKSGWTGLYSVMLSQAETDATIQVVLSIVP